MTTLALPAADRQLELPFYDVVASPPKPVRRHDSAVLLSCVSSVTAQWAHAFDRGFDSRPPQEVAAILCGRITAAAAGMTPEPPRLPQPVFLIEHQPATTVEVV